MRHENQDMNTTQDYSDFKVKYWSDSSVKFFYIYSGTKGKYLNKRGAMQDVTTGGRWETKVEAEMFLENLKNPPVNYEDFFVYFGDQEENNYIYNPRTGMYLDCWGAASKSCHRWTDGKVCEQFLSSLKGGQKFNKPTDANPKTTMTKIEKLNITNETFVGAVNKDGEKYFVGNAYGKFSLLNSDTKKPCESSYVSKNGLVKDLNSTPYPWDFYTFSDKKALYTWLAQD